MNETIKALLTVWPIAIAAMAGIAWVGGLQWRISDLSYRLGKAEGEIKQLVHDSGTMFSEVRERLVRIETILTQKRPE